MPSFATLLRSVAALTVAASLAACSGGSNSLDIDLPAPPTAADDAATAATGRDQIIDVLANDRDAAGGALTLVTVLGQGQSTLAIDGNRIRYRPRCCDITADEFRYTVRNAAGGIASATVRVAVERRVRISGTVSDLAAPYTLARTDGERAAPPPALTADGYAFDVDFNTDDALIRLDARRTVDGRVQRLVTLLGSASDLASRAGGDGELLPGDHSELRLSPLSTAIAGVLAERNAGVLPATMARRNELLAQPTDVEDVLLRAQLVRAALTDAAFGATVADTYLLASDGTAVAAARDRQREDFALLDRSALFGPADRSALIASAETLWLYRGGLAQDDVVARFDLAAGGTGTALTPSGSVPLRWSTTAGVTMLEAGDPAAPLLRFGVQTGHGLCTVGNPVGRHSVRMRVNQLALRSLLPLRSVEDLRRMAVDYAGMQTVGITPSGCQPLVAERALQPAVGAIVTSRPRGVQLPDGPLNGRWLLPRLDSGCEGGPLDPCVAPSGRVALDGNRGGRGLFDEDAGVVSAAAVADGVLRIVYAGGEARLHAVAESNGVYRVVGEFETAGGARHVREAWLAREDETLNLDALWRDRELRDCCRAGGLMPTLRATDGTIDRAGAVEASLAGRRLSYALTSPGPRPPGRLTFTAIRALADGRVLLLTRFDDRLPVADVVRFEPRR